MMKLFYVVTMLVLSIGNTLLLSEAIDEEEFQKPEDPEVGSLDWITVPINTAVVTEGRTSFICINGVAPTLNWLFTPLGATDYVIIASNCQINPDYADRFALENFATGRCDVVVKNATIADAGAYGCQAGFQVVARAQLVVLASAPVCSSDASEPVLPGEKVTYICEVSYTSNLSPMLMSWTDSLGAPISSYTNTSLPGRTFSSIAVVGNAVTLSSHTCTSYFSEPGNLSSDADNAPTYRYVWNSPNYRILTSGVGYIRWGRTTCEKDAELVYKGYIVGSTFGYSGNGANYLCAHETPQWGPGNVAGAQGTASYIFGTEYRVTSPYTNNLPFSFENVGGATLNGQDAVCAVCYRPKRTYNLMIPFRHDCGPAADWILEYKGYLVSNYHTGSTSYHRTEYICMDEAPEARAGGAAGVMSDGLYPVQAICQALPCTEFIGGNEVTCAVCSR